MERQNPALQADCRAPGEEVHHSLLCGLQLAPGLPPWTRPPRRGPWPSLRSGRRPGRVFPRLSRFPAPRAPRPSSPKGQDGGLLALDERRCAVRVVVWTDDLSLYARLAPALWAAGVAVSWREGEGLPLADLAHLERGEVFFWPTPWGLRVYDPRRRAFLTRKDDPKTLAEGLRGRLGLRLTGREAGVPRGPRSGGGAQAFRLGPGPGPRPLAGPLRSPGAWTEVRPEPRGPPPPRPASGAGSGASGPP